MVHAKRPGIVCRTGLGPIIAAGPPMDPAVSRIYAPFYSSAFTWNYALGMTQLQIQLYARELGYSGVVPRSQSQVIRPQELPSELHSLTNLVCRLLLEKK